VVRGRAEERRGGGRSALAERRRAAGSTDVSTALRIIVVDDHAGFRQRARALLEEGGIDVVGEASDGPGCLDLVERLRPDGVLLDVRLPGEDGFAVAGRICASLDPPSVVLVSTRSLADYGSRELPGCVRGFIAKAELTTAAVLDLLDS